MRLPASLPIDLVPNTYGSMATVHCWRGDDVQARADVKLAESNGGLLSPKFLSMLGDRLKRPD